MFCRGKNVQTLAEVGSDLGSLRYFVFLSVGS